MKAIMIIYLLIIHIFVVIVIVKTDVITRFQLKLGYEIPQPELTPHYYKMLTYHKRIDKNLPDKSILFIGDSMIQGLASTAIHPNSVNYGIGKDTTAGVLNRIPFYHSIPQSKMVIIAIGVNDLKIRDNIAIINNYKKIINLIPKNILLLFSAILPVNEVADNKTNDRIRKLNQRLNKICVSNRRLHFLNISNLISNEDGNLSDDYHIGDGIHLNELGNKIWITKLKIAIKTLLKNGKE